MKQSPRIRAKIRMYSYFMKVIGIFDNEEYQQLTNKLSKRNRYLRR